MVDSIFDWFCCTILALSLARFCNCSITWKLVMQFCFRLAKGHHQAKQVDNVNIGFGMTSTSILSNKWPCCNFDATYNITTIYKIKRIKCMVYVWYQHVLEKTNLRTNNWNKVMRLMDGDLFCRSYMLCTLPCPQLLAWSKSLNNLFPTMCIHRLSWYPYA